MMTGNDSKAYGLEWHIPYLIAFSLSLSLSNSVTRWLYYISRFGKFVTMKISQIMSQMCQSRLSIIQIRNKLLKIYQTLVNFCQSGYFSPNLVTLVSNPSTFLTLSFSLTFSYKFPHSHSLAHSLFHSIETLFHSFVMLPSHLPNSSLPYSVTRKNRQMSIEVAPKWFH